jgi:hypothetical protein
MYARLAEDAMNRQEHVDALPLFAKARDLCPPGQHPEMDTLSLVRHSTQSFGENLLECYERSAVGCMMV